MNEGNFTALEALAGYQVRKVHSISVNSLTHDLSSEDFRVSEAAVLLQIFEAPGITASEIGRILRMKRSNITPIISRFNKLDLLDSEEIDGRSTALRLSEAGAEKCRKLQDIIANHDKTVFADRLSADEFEQFKHLLRKVGVEPSPS